MIKVSPWPPAGVDEATSASDAAAAALSAMLATDWLMNVGRASTLDHTVARVSSWPEASEIFKPGPRHVTGILATPAYYLLGLLDGEPDQKTAHAANAAASAAASRVDFYPFIPDDLPLSTDVALGDYLTSYVRFLFLEIFAASQLKASCSFFRDQFGWFTAGFFPCGWVGDWPSGRMRVF